MQTCQPQQNPTQNWKVHAGHHVCTIINFCNNRNTTIKTSDSPKVESKSTTLTHNQHNLIIEIGIGTCHNTILRIGALEGPHLQPLMQNYNFQHEPNAKIGTCDALNVDPNLAAHIHHQHDPIAGTQICTRHSELLMS